MSTYVGADWASNGWFAVGLSEDGDAEMGLYPSIFNLWYHHDDADRILVDIPIGLRSGGKRACDVEARRLLGGSRGSSVFYTPTREAVAAETITEAKRAQEGLDFSVQNQAWALVPRIQEVDEFLTMFADDLADTEVRETHPEVCFTALNGGEPMAHDKQTAAGREERLTALSAALPTARRLYEEAVETFTEPEWAPVVGKSGRDDIIDAMVAALTARECGSSPPRLPAETAPEVDAVHDREIEIVYWPTLE